MEFHPLLPQSIPVNAERWKHGTSTPAVGDLWIVSWDGTDLGLVLIVAVRDSHVVIWPVTDESVTPSAPCFRVTADWLNDGLVGWPEAEAGLSYAALGRNLGNVLDSKTTLGIYVAIRDDSALPNVDTYPEVDSDGADDALAYVCGFASALSDLDFPDPDTYTGSLNPSFAEAHGLDARAVAALVGGLPAIARQIVEGGRLLPSTTAEALARQYDVPVTEVVSPIEGEEVVALRSPDRKAKIVSLAERRQVRENDVRLDAWQESRLAARQQGGTDARTAAAARVDRALDLLDTQT